VDRRRFLAGTAAALAARPARSGATPLAGRTVRVGMQRVATVAVSNVGRMEAGPWRGRNCIGSSLAVGPNGAVLARLPYGVDAEAFRAVDVPLAV
jgi:hypothetical protein